ncbi:leaf rust 10 disease-resistance locus receptor-like protein kinase [Sesbania bispinosa]|nr:leaf rust 10 disease-resistance locus receptor-like protein kinase [Sesbania bispinosa]
MFKLDCHQDNVTIDAKLQKFLVIDMNKNSQILKIARLDLLSQTCPTQYINVTVDSSFLSYTFGDVICTILYDCPVSNISTLNSDSSMPFTCLIDGNPHRAYLVLSTNVEDFNDVGCKNKIKVRVLRVAVQSSTRASENLWEMCLQCV